MSVDASSRNKGSLFENTEKRKPSHPDLKGDATLEGAAYEISAWRRDEQLAITLAPARVGTNQYPPDAFKGALDPAPKTRGKGGGEKPVWIGSIVGDERSYTLSAFEKQGKSGTYLRLVFEPLAMEPPPPTSPVLPDSDD
jgi:hypothetical protein